MKKLILLLVSAALIIALHPAGSFAVAQWEGGIKIYYGDDSQILAFGADPTATDGFENRWETMALLGGYIQAYFYHPEWGLNTPYYWRDIRNLLLPKEWAFYVASSYTDRQITLSWNISNIPATVNLSLVDEFTGTPINMRSQPSYVYTNTSTAVRAFRVDATGYLESAPPSGDTTAPETAIITAPDSYINTSSATVTYSGTDDTSPQDRLQFSYRIDDGAWSAWSGATSATLNGLTDGAHTFYVKAKDESGNEDQTPAAVGFTIDTIAPVIVLNQPNPSVLWPPNGMMMNVTVSGTAKDNSSGLASVFYTVSDEYGQFGSSGSVSPQNDGTFSFVSSLKAERHSKDIDGRIYTITVNAVDRAGNFTSSSIQVIVPHNRN